MKVLYVLTALTFIVHLVQMELLEMGTYTWSCTVMTESVTELSSKNSEKSYFKSMYASV